MPLSRVSARRLLAAAILGAALALIAGCASVPPAPAPPVAYLPPAGETLIARHAPVIVPADTRRRYNRIGRPRARRDARGAEEVYIDPAEPVVYAQRRTFTTARGRYTNLIYRFHFERVPFSLIPFHLTAGKNGGLIVVVTLDSGHRPLLLTTVHTCGCYLAFVPTRHLPPAAYPQDWDPRGQRVFGIRLPGRLDGPTPDAGEVHPVIFVRSGTHRVEGLGLAGRGELARRYRPLTYELAPMAALEALPLDGSTTSFFATEGFRKGYVKGSFKPLELLLMSWWTFDLNVGVDKAYGDAQQTGTVFYTSLRPWRRAESDMWDFARFLAFWGWRL